MAKQTINIGTSANDGTGDPLRTAMDKTNDNFTELYNGAGGVADGSVTSAKLAADAVTQAKIAADAVGANQLASSAVVTASIVDSNVTTAKIADNNITTSKLADDAISYAKMGAEFTTIQALTGTTVDWSAATVFTKTITGTEALTFSNVETGKVIDLVLTGGTAVTLPASVNLISGTYDPAVYNLIQITATNGSTEQWAVISKPAV